MSSENACGGILNIDLNALVENWRILKGQLRDRADCAAAVKADAYGLGAGPAACALAKAGCRHFFVAMPEEGIHLRKALNDAGLKADIHILAGPLDMPGAQEHNLIPVLNSLYDIQVWKEFQLSIRSRLPADLHVDTGMLRLGLPPDELSRIADNPEILADLEIGYVLSHLASADEEGTDQNERQLSEFKTACTILKAKRASFANSSGIFLGPEFHFDLARTGVALYGVNPLPGRPNPMSQVVSLQGKILQVRNVDTPQTVGYGATHRIKKPGRIATVGVGYADGYLRSLSNCGSGFLGGCHVPLVGRVSMDLITFDVSDVPEKDVHPGAFVELLGQNVTVDNVAEAAGTIGYEILTSLGSRYHRVYHGGEG